MAKQEGKLTKSHNGLFHLVTMVMEVLLQKITLSDVGPFVTLPAKSMHWPLWNIHHNQHLTRLILAFVWPQ